MNERPNMYPGKCAYCIETVEEGKGFVFDDLARGWRSKVRHPHCNEATEEARREGQSKSAWGAAVAGTAAPKKLYTLEEAADAVLPHVEGLDEAEALERMLGEALGQAIEDMDKSVAAIWEANVPPMVEEHVERLLQAHRPVAISVGDMPAVEIDSAHMCMEDLLVMVMAGASPFLVGPAGSGKTTLGEQVAKALGRKFYMAARVTSEYKLVGFIDANGNCIRTQFREAFEHGGVFLFDEVDASDPDAMTAFNAALANGWCDFPDGMVHKHPDFVAVAAGNTYGRGADRQYVGRNQLDAATLDRFQILVVDYDEALEMKIAGCDPWTRYVQAVRAAVEDTKVRHIVSPRASIMGAKLIAAGMELPKVIEATVWKGLDADAKGRILSGSGINPVYQALLRYIARNDEPEAPVDHGIKALPKNKGDALNIRTIEYMDERVPFDGVKWSPEFKCNVVVIEGEVFEVLNYGGGDDDETGEAASA